MADTFFRNTDSRIFYENPGITRFFIFFITESDKAATGELGSVINKVIDYLLQADIICRKIFLVARRHTQYQFYARRHIQALRIMDSFEQ